MSADTSNGYGEIVSGSKVKLSETDTNVYDVGEVYVNEVKLYKNCRFVGIFNKENLIVV